MNVFNHVNMQRNHGLNAFGFNSTFKQDKLRWLKYGARLVWIFFMLKNVRIHKKMIHILSQIMLPQFSRNGILWNIMETTMLSMQKSAQPDLCVKYLIIWDYIKDPLLIKRCETMLLYFREDRFSSETVKKELNMNL